MRDGWARWRAGRGGLAVLSGAGLSAAAGLATFRGTDGLWEGHRPEDLATAGAFDRDPERVWRWYAWRLERVLGARPTAAHRLLARLAAHPGTALVTQNVDGLLQAAGAAEVVELHGSIRRGRCTGCGRRSALDAPPAAVPTCSACAGRVRPDVVWFGETLDPTALRAAEEAFATAAVAIVVGTSGVVWPAAGLAHAAKSAGAPVVVVDPAPTALDPVADVLVRSGADEGLRRLVASLDRDQPGDGTGST